MGFVTKRQRFFWMLVLLSCSAIAVASATTVKLSPVGPAVVWSRDITITGVVSPQGATAGVLFVQGVEMPFSLTDTTFTVPVRLNDGTTTIVARVDSAGVPGYSDTLRLTLGYNIRPECFAYATASGNNVTLHASILENPDTSSLTFQWVPRATNPAQVTVSPSSDSVASVSFAAGMPKGEYYFNVSVATSHGDTVKASTFVTVDSAAIRPFNIKTDHAHWIDSAIVYGVSPYMFVDNTRFTNITAKIPELAGLGVTALWIQPIYSTTDPDQGYAVTDYFTFRSSLGSESDLQSLVNTAHQYGIRVLLDFVPNHTSTSHPYAQSGIQYGRRSYYYSFYQHNADDGARYSGNYATETLGLMPFVYYGFWGSDLVNLNYNTPDVQRWIIEASRYWVEKFDVDGYRFDAVWGVTARTPEFTRAWRHALKRVKPEILLLAEDKAKYAPVFDERFDAAYDWSGEEGWVSHWNWQPQFSPDNTIFNNTSPNNRASLLRAALTGFPPSARVLHFMENNDTYRFLARHDLARTTMVGQMLFSLPGIPLLFNGQEIGVTAHPYDAMPIFQSNKSIESQSKYGLFAFYKNVINMRKRFPALIGDNFAEVPVGSSTVFAYRRWEGNQNIFPVLNMASTASTVQMQLPVGDLNLDSTRTYYLTDYFSGQTFTGTKATLASLAIPLSGYSARILVLDTVAITGVEPGPIAEIPTELSLSQNFPNPFNPLSNIKFTVGGGRGEGPGASVNITVYDLLGREVAVLVNERKAPGTYHVTFDGSRLASGVYLYRMTVGSFVQTRKMLLLK
jgi:cyclomaltodextrinase / maltogenic alpha-amylase / neopullulanase